MAANNSIIIKIVIILDGSLMSDLLIVSSVSAKRINVRIWGMHCAALVYWYKQS